MQRLCRLREFLVDFLLDFLVQKIPYRGDQTRDIQPPDPNLLVEFRDCAERLGHAVLMTPVGHERAELVVRRDDPAVLFDPASNSNGGCEETLLHESLDRTMNLPLAVRFLCPRPSVIRLFTSL